MPSVPKIIKQCAHCEKVMECPPRLSHKKYCTEQCRQAVRATTFPKCACGNSKHRQATSCRTCAKYTRYSRFLQVAIQTRQQRISHKMQALLETQAPKPTSRVFKGGSCKVCGKGFLSLYRDKTCSEPCQIRYATEARNDSKQRRRARERQAFVSTVSRIAIYERDGWTCKLCCQPIDRQAKAPEPLSASIDHVIPLSKGGTHEPSNVQASHFLCNSIKGARDDMGVFSIPGGPTPLH